jgi:hypothetical protein
MSPTWGPQIFHWHWLGTVLAPLPTLHNYDWPNALKPSYKTNTSSTVITRPPNWNNTVTQNIDTVHSSKMSEHLTTTQVRKPNDHSRQINYCMKSSKCNTEYQNILKITATVLCLNLHTTASDNKGMILRELYSNIILEIQQNKWQ